MNNKRFDFSAFCKIEEKKVEEIGNLKGENYLYMVIQENLSKEAIDFTMFTLDEVIRVFEDLEGIITDEDMEGRVSLDPRHPYTRMWALTEKIMRIGKLPKQRPASPYQFL